MVRVVCLSVEDGRVFSQSRAQSYAGVDQTDRCQHRLFSGLSLQIIAAAMAWLILASNAMTAMRLMVMLVRLIVENRSAVTVWSKAMKNAMIAMTRIAMVV